jgi:tRNA threonylcarbamoyladenosine biosynthesis protein TsaB
VIVLAFDTTTRAGSVAVVRDGTVVYEAAGDPARTHGQRLPADLMRAMEATGLDIAAVDLIAVAAGPGSFTGLRVGIATAQGLAMAHGRRVVPISVLEALAASVPDDVGAVGAWVDAQRGQVFAALYAGDRRTPMGPPTAATPEETLEAWREQWPADRVRFVGDGAVRYADAIVAAGGDASPPPPLLAPIIGRLAAGAPDRAVLPHAVVPIYIRRPDAELARARREGAP